MDAKERSLHHAVTVVDRTRLRTMRRQQRLLAKIAYRCHLPGESRAAIVEGVQVNADILSVFANDDLGSVQFHKHCLDGFAALVRPPQRCISRNNGRLWSYRDTTVLNLNRATGDLGEVAQKFGDGDVSNA